MTFRLTRCPHCKGKLIPGQRIHPGCIDAYAEASAKKAERTKAKAERMAAKVDRAETRKRKEANKTLPQLHKEAQAEFNRWIRWRDRNEACICCGRPLRGGCAGASSGGEYDAGHYRSVGSASHLRYTEANVHGQTKHCNRYGAGRAVDYRIGLIERIGRQAVESLESDSRVHKWSRDEVRAIRDKYRALNRQAGKERFYDRGG